MLVIIDSLSQLQQLGAQKNDDSFFCALVADLAFWSH